MYESYTKQALPSREYRELLGTAICVFNSNNNFVVENILRLDDEERYNWRELIDKYSSNLQEILQNKLGKDGTEIIPLFKKIIQSRNRIVHSYHITEGDEQILATKDREEKGSKQYTITKDHLLDFIHMNDELSSLLHDLRGF